MKWHENITEEEFDQAIEKAIEDGWEKGYLEAKQELAIIENIPVNSSLGLKLYPAARLKGLDPAEYAIQKLEEIHDKQTHFGEKT